MKKLIILLFISFNIATNCQAQDNGYISISLGPSIPIGSFGSSEDGLAKIGAIFDISFAYKFGGGKFGILTMLRGQANPLDVQFLADEIAYQIPGIYWTVKSSGWGIGGLMVGGYGSLPISEKVSIEPRSMLGFLSTTLSEITITGSSQGSYVWVKQGSASATSVAYLVGLGIKFDIGRKLCLLTNLDFMSSKPRFVNVETTTSLGTLERDTWQQSVETINIGVGLALKI